MGGNAGFLSMRADGDRYTESRQLCRFACAIVIDIIIFWRNDAAGVVRVQDRRWLMLLQQRMFPHIGMRAPIGITGQAAIGDDQCRCIANLGPRIKLQHIIVKHIQRDVVLDSGIAISNQCDVHAVQRAALGNRTYAFFYGRCYNLLALFAAWLVVVFDAMRPLRL